MPTSLFFLPDSYKANQRTNGELCEVSMRRRSRRRIIRKYICSLHSQKFSKFSPMTKALQVLLNSHSELDSESVFMWLNEYLLDCYQANYANRFLLTSSVQDIITFQYEYQSKDMPCYSLLFFVI